MEIFPLHIVVGGGTSGILLSRRLLESGHRVLLLERGSAPAVADPLVAEKGWINEFLNIFPSQSLWTVQSQDPLLSKLIETVPQQRLNQRRINYSSTYGLGGNSNINAMICDIGSLDVFDKYWPTTWNSERIKLYLAVVDRLITTAKLSTSGNMKAFINSMESNPNVKQIHTEYEATINPDEPTSRWRLERLLLDWPFIATGQLKVIYDCIVERVLIQDGFAHSVVDTRGNKFAPHHGEIILCCGAFETPKLLFRSGLNLPGLGQSLKDHVVVPHISLGNWYQNWRIRKDRRKSSFQYPLNSVHGWVFLDAEGNVLDRDSKKIPCCQLLFIDGFISSGTCELLIPNYSGSLLFSKVVRPCLIVLLKVNSSHILVNYYGYPLQFVCSFSIFQWLLGFLQGILVCLVQPHSAGCIDMETGQIDPKFLHDSKDMDALIHACVKTNDLFCKASRENKHLWFLNFLPGPLFNFGCAKENVVWYIRNFATTYYHPCGTCRMAKSSHFDRLDVVNENLQVLGVQNLRVADASIVCHIANVPIAKLCMVIGIAAAEKILNNDH